VDGMTAIRHTVAFALPFAPHSAEEQEFLAEARRLAEIPGVQAFRVLRALDEQAELPLSLSMDFADRAAYDGYNEHPQHRGFVEGRWLPTITAFREADHSIESAD
jgi:heme-degrading monooxygenase HmoA